MLFLGLLFFSLASASAQAPQVKLEATTRLVQLTVVVQDGNGQPVKDLKQADFAVLDQGAPQKISFFSLESSGKSNLGPLQAEPGVVSNIGERRLATSGAVTAILLDVLNTDFSDLAYARQQLLQFLGKAGPGDVVALYALGQELTVVQDFTNDPSRLMKTLAANPKKRIESLVDKSDPASLGYFQYDDPTIRTVKALTTIAHHMSGLPGRKNLIWISAGLPAVLGLADAVAGGGNAGAGGTGALKLGGTPLSSIRNFDKELWDAIRAMNNADVAVYPIDARGLMVTGGGNAGIFTMQQLARQTGGKAFVNANDLSGAIRRVIDDSQVSYRLAYYPTSVRGDNSFHTVTVRTNRPGLTVQCRRGYFDMGEPAQDEESRKAAVRPVLASHLNATGLSVSARVVFTSHTSLQVDVLLDPADIRFGQQGEALSAKLDFVLVPMDAHGQAFRGVFDPLPIKLQPAEYQRVAKNGIFYRRQMECQRKARMLKVVVRDTTTGAVGSVTVALDRSKQMKGT